MLHHSTTYKLNSFVFPSKSDILANASVAICMSGHCHIRLSFGSFYLFNHICCMLKAMALAKLRFCAVSHDPSQPSHAIRPKVRKRTKIRNGYNQAPHLTQDTYEKVTNSQLVITNESQEVSPFPANDYKALIKYHKRLQLVSWVRCGA